MIDKMSRGRMQVGIGRGISPLETKGFGVDPAERMERYEGTRQVMMQGLTQKSVTFKGKFFAFDNVPMELEPFQKPHPPFWAGVGTPEGGEMAGRNGFCMVANALTPVVRQITDRYRAAYRSAHPNAAGSPMLGLSRFVIMGETDVSRDRARELKVQRVTDDPVQGGLIATDYLLKRGRRRIAAVFGYRASSMTRGTKAT